MNPFEVFSFAKLFSTVMNGQMSVSSAEMEAACKLLKEMADNNQYMTSEQKEAYKLMVDCAKEASKGKQ
jgi:hypothetical protein